MQFVLRFPFAVIYALLAFTVSIQAQGVIVPQGVVTNLFAGEIDLNWAQETQINGFSLTPMGKQQPTLYPNIFNFDEPVTIGVRVFLVNAGDTVSLQPILSSSYTELQDGQNYVFKVGAPFYVGLYSGANVAPPYPPTSPYNYLDPVFGWAELENVNGTIELLNNALEYQGAGIIAGTDTIIPTPEPSTWALLACGAGLFAIRRRKRKR
jgi:hypothetical protein